MKQLHFWTGLIFVLIFLLTGQYMDQKYDHLQGMEDVPRMIFRSGHIYLLFAAVLNLVSGVYLEPLIGIRRTLQLLVSILFLFLPWILLAGFFQEPHLEALDRPWSRSALYGTFGAALMLAVLGFKRN